MHRLCLFDIDGTLVDTAGAGRFAAERAFQRVFGITTLPRSAGNVRYAGMTDRTIFNGVGQALGIDPQELDRQRDTLEQTYLDELRGQLARDHPKRRVLPGVRELLERLAARDDVQLSLLTGNIEAGARAKLDVFGLNDYFTTGGFGSDHENRIEVAKVAYRRSVELLGVDIDADAVSVIGDTEHDVRCAQANGFRAIAVVTGWVSSEHLERFNPDALLPDLRDQAAFFRAAGLGS